MGLFDRLRSKPAPTPAQHWAAPAMIEVTFPAGFTPAEATRVSPRRTRSTTNSESPACSASAITGTSPADDTKRSSSNRGVALDQA